MVVGEFWILGEKGGGVETLVPYFWGYCGWISQKHCYEIW